jgi:hypothetical protein
MCCYVAYQNHSLKFISKGCFVWNYHTQKLIVYVHWESGQGFYRLHGITMVDPLKKVNLVSPHGLTKSDLYMAQEVGSFPRGKNLVND